MDGISVPFQLARPCHQSLFQRGDAVNNLIDLFQVRLVSVHGHGVLIRLAACCCGLFVFALLV